MKENGRCYALILAGGKSSRMGREKALITVEGKTLLERAAAFWNSSGIADRILLAAGTPEHLKNLGPLPEDIEPVLDVYDDCGPMAGILSAFRQTGAELLCVSAVDMPCLKPGAAELLLEKINKGEEKKEGVIKPDAAVFMMNGRPEPLFGVYRRSTADAAERLLRSGKRKMSDLLNSVETVYCKVPDSLEEIFRNVNTPEDLQRLEGGVGKIVCSPDCTDR